MGSFPAWDSESGKPWERLRGGRHVVAPRGAVSESWVPAVEVAGHPVVEDAGADLEQQVGAAGSQSGPLLQPVRVAAFRGRQASPPGGRHAARRRPGHATRARDLAGASSPGTGDPARRAARAYQESDSLIYYAYYAC